MSFQGDVGGIGLAELLQSLARGRRDGVLHLHSRDGLSARLGLKDGVVSFLPDEGEDPVRWQNRVRQAWIDDQDFRAEAMRLTQVARAHRIERIHRILDSEGVHFRFNPGEAHHRPGAAGGEDSPGGARMPEVHCDPMPVEFLLLEYARLSDEAQGLGTLPPHADHLAPRNLDPAGAAERRDRFLLECDGRTTLAEIADRLGLPIREARLVLLDRRRAGLARLADWREMLVIAQHELGQGHLHRASARLIGWLHASPPGPVDLGAAELLAGEFRADRMGPVLNLLPAREARMLLRRVDRALADPAAEVRHWRELQRLKRSCPISLVHRVAAESRWEEDPEVPTLREVLDLARRLREDGTPGRAAAFLRLAARFEPENVHTRLEIGLGFLAVDLVEEAAAWILDACETLIAAGHGEKALGALHTLLEADGGIREARRMLGRLRHLTLRRQLIRKHSLVGISIVLLLGATAWVRIHVEQDREHRLAEVAAAIGDPRAAHRLLETHFPDDTTERVQNLREMIVDRRKYQETEARNGWNEAYREAQMAGQLEDPVSALEQALAIPPPPRLELLEPDFRLLGDLFNGLAARFEREHDELGPIDLDDAAQVDAELGLRDRTDGLLEHIATLDERQRMRCEDLGERLTVIRKDLLARIQDRSDRLAARTMSDRLHGQDLLLARARSAREAGQFDRSLAAYEELLATDTSGKLARILGEEVGEVRARHEALRRADELAGEGRHEEALEVLDATFDGPGEEAHALPWKLEVFPAGALVHLDDGSTRPAPFLLESRPGQPVRLRVELEGHHPVELLVERPADQLVQLSRVAERAWSRGGRVDALPVPYEGDHLVCDRTGHVARLGAGGEIRWETELRSLGGFARTPVFLPRLDGRFLLVTEDGEAWILDAADGTPEGPWSLGARPVAGPSPTPEGALARLDDGRVVRWTERVRPEEIEDADLPDLDRDGARAGLAVRRRAEVGLRPFDSPWSGWRVTLEEDAYRVRPAAEDAGGYAVRRDGDWSFLAWEAPTPGAPAGRLWISDGAGIAAYGPSGP